MGHAHPSDPVGSASALRGRDGALYFALALGFVLLMRAGAIAAVARGTLYDPDSYMTLLRIREELARERVLDAIARDGSGHGLALPWSHLMDAAILVLRAPLRLVLSPDAALYWAGAVTGPLAVGLLGIAVAWTVAPVARRGWLWTAPVAVSLTPGVLGYGQLGCVTHHLPLVLLVVMGWGHAGRAALGDGRAGWCAGLFAGLGIWMSPEAMPFGLMGLGVIGLAWIMRPGPGVGAALRGAGGGLLATIAFALLVDPPQGGRSVAELDRISVVFLCLAAIVCALCWTTCVLDGRRLSLRTRFTAAAAGAGLGAALWLALFPAYLRGLGGLMTPEQARAFFGPIQEMRPLLTLRDLAAFTLTGALAVLGGVVLGWRARGLPGALWLYAALCAAAGLALAVAHRRFAVYPEAAGAMMLPVLLTEASRPALARWRPLLRPGLIAAFLLLPFLPAALGIVSPAEAAQARAEAKAAHCAVGTLAPALRPYAGAVVLADVNDTPELLYRTGVRTVGSLYHPGIAAFMRLRAAWRARDLGHVPAALRATEARYVLACPGALRTSLVDGPRTTLFDRLDRGDPPTWLTPVLRDPASGFVLYRINGAQG